MTKKRKRKNARTLIALVCVLILMIVSYILLIQHKKEEEKDTNEEPDTSIPLNEMETSDIKEMQVSNDNWNFTLVNQEEIWRLQGEEAFPLDQSTVSSLANSMASLSATKQVTEEAEDLAEYGLDSPEITVIIKKSDDSLMTLTIGDQLTTGSDYYASINTEDTVYVVNALVRNAFTKVKNDLMEIEELPTLNTELITGLKVDGSKYPNFSLMYDKDNKEDFSGSSLYPWYITGYYKENANADLTAVNEMLANYTSISFKGGIDYKKENLALYGLETPKDALSIWYLEEEAGDVKELTLYLGNQDEQGDYYVRLGGSNRTYTMTESVVTELFDIDVFSLTSKTTNLINIDSISNFTVSTGSISHLYTVDKETSTDSDGNETTTDIFAVDGVAYENEEVFRSFYQSIIGLSVDGVLPENATVSEDEVLHISFQIKDDAGKDNKTYTVDYLPYDDENYAVRTNGKILFTISKEKISTVIETIKNFK